MSEVSGRTSRRMDKRVLEKHLPCSLSCVKMRGKGERATVILTPPCIVDHIHKDQKSPFLMSGYTVADGYGTMLSCIKVDLGFVSPDNVEECIRLTYEFCLLLKAHRSKEDKLEWPHLHALDPSTVARERWEVVVGLLGNGESNIGLKTSEWSNHASLSRAANRR
ncbi:hypothetical protein Tco_1194147 [Tanacetum coccineum]